MRYVIRVAITAVMLLLVSAPAFAQGQLFFFDETDNLDRGSIERAAQPLLDRGAQVAVYMVNQGGETDLDNRLRADGLINADGLVRDTMIVVYVDLGNRQSAIKFGDRWNEALAINDNFQYIIETKLNPELTAGDFTQGFVNALDAIEESVVNPPQPGGGTTFNINFIPVIIGVFVLITAFVVWGVVSRRRAAARAMAEARQRMEEARQSVGNAIASMGQLLKTAREKAEFDSVSYAPADVESLAKDQREVERSFAQAQTLFDDVGEELERRAEPTIEQYDEATAGYQKALAQVNKLRPALEGINTRRVELDNLARQAHREIDRLKKC